ncbi:hypothetical protein B0H16DRAFT_1563586 [Mycena metata]|uniref:Uncharacterized protein n=1 Tax=Mycena metata TaxID=1033252 RepID=A0AAD7IHW1_9AGAR|nr:hypothetical protein B0H16DRAFT_1563586 [Mycena metata]
MSDHPEQPKSKFRDSVKDRWLKVEDVAHKGTSKLKNVFHLTPKHSPAPSPQPSRSPTPAPSNREGPPSGATATNPESAPSHVDNGEDSSKGGHPAQTDTSGTAQSKPGLISILTCISNPLTPSQILTGKRGGLTTTLFPNSERGALVMKTLTGGNSPKKSISP